MKKKYWSVCYLARSSLLSDGKDALLPIPSFLKRATFNRCACFIYKTLITLWENWILTNSLSNSGTGQLDQRRPAEAFRLLLEAFRLQRPDNENYFGRLSLLSHGVLQAGIKAAELVMHSFAEYARPYTTELFFLGELHPNGTDCTAGGDSHCTVCGKFAGNSWSEN